MAQTTRNAADSAVNLVDRVGRWTISTVEEIGNGGFLMAESLYWLFMGPSLKQPVRLNAIVLQMMEVGIKAIPIIAMLGGTIGAMLAIQSIYMLRIFGAESQVTYGVAFSVVREFAPLITGILIAGRSGSALAARLGTMKISQEIDALKVMGINPVRFLVVPRLLATVIMTVLLTVIADVVMILGGWLTSLQLGIDTDVFYQMTLDAVNITGFITGLVKAAVFGLLVGLMGCYLGLSVQPWQGSEGVGRATTNTVVYSIVAIIGADAVFTVIFYAYGLFN
ncbi:MAG: ABC transporter permease [Phycisphaerae bacterium]|nr:ABC transporter permease [Phycisphaerae bacterium]